MKKIVAISLLVGMCAFGLACNGTTTTNTNANRPNSNGISQNLPIRNSGTPWVDTATPTPHRDMNTVPNSGTNSTNTNSAATNSRTNKNSAATNTRTNSASPANRTNSNR